MIIAVMTALIVAVVAIAVAVDEILAHRRAQRAAARGIDIEDLLILMGAEGWSEPNKQEGAP